MLTVVDFPSQIFLDFPSSISLFINIVIYGMKSPNLLLCISAYMFFLIELTKMNMTYTKKTEPHIWTFWLTCVYDMHIHVTYMGPITDEPPILTASSSI